MKIFAVSDLHLSINNPKPMYIFGGAWENYVEQLTENWEKLISDEDIVLIAGDISWAMSMINVVPDLDFISTFKGTKIILRGNHDYWWSSISKLRNILPPRMYAVQNDAVKIGNVVVCGSRGWTAPENGTQTAEDKKIYDRELIRMEMSLESAKKVRTEADKLIVMTHYPPFNSKLSQSPFTSLIAKYSPDAVIYGHLHGKAGRYIKIFNMDGIPYYLTSCDLINNIPVKILEI